MLDANHTEPAREFVPRRAICLECRTALPDGVPCSWITHSLVDMGDPSGWLQLQARVWGTPSRRRLILPPAGLVLAFVALFVACVIAAIWVVVAFFPEATGTTRHSVRGALVIVALIVGVPTMAAYQLLQRHWQRTRVDREHDRPRGAATTPLPSRGDVVLSGRIEAAGQAPCPLSREPCVGFAIELERSNASGSPVMLRDAASLGFAVVEDGGRTIRIRPGALDVVGPRHEVRDRESVATYLTALAPPPVGADDGREHPPFPWDRAREALLRPGDWVTVRCAAEALAGVSAPESPYREPAGRILIARGTPIIELQDPAGR